MQPIVPNVSVLVTNELGRENQITTEVTRHLFGQQSAGGLSENWQLINNSMVVIGSETASTNAVTIIYNFLFTSLTTSEKSYTKFKYIQ